MERVIFKLNTTTPAAMAALSAKLSHMGISAISPLPHPETSRHPSSAPTVFTATIPTAYLTELNVDELRNHPHVSPIRASLVGDNADASPLDYLEPLYPISLFTTKTDPLKSQQDYMTALKLDQLSHLRPIRPVVIAVIDSGVDYRHEDLVKSIHINANEIPNNNVDDDGNGWVDDYYGYDFYGVSMGQGDSNPMDAHGHGTHIASIIAAQRNNNIGMAGISNAIQILPIKFTDDHGAGNQADAAAAIRYALDRGVDVINLSWGFFKINTLLVDAISDAIQHGVVVIAAAGNAGVNITQYPAGLPEVIAVGAGTKDNTKSFFSSYGPHIDFIAPGTHILGAAPGDEYVFLTGTSQSTAIVTGVVGALLSSVSGLTTSPLLHYLIEAADPALKTDYVGHGAIDIDHLLSRIDTAQYEWDQAQVDPIRISSFYAYPNPIRGRVAHFHLQTTRPAESVDIQLFDLAGNRVDFVQQSGLGVTDWEFGWELPQLHNGTYLVHVTVTDVTGQSVSFVDKCSVLQ
jgi:hypothetical protein